MARFGGAGGARKPRTRRHATCRTGRLRCCSLIAPQAACSDPHASAAHAAGRSSILHLSDLHFGADYGFLAQGERAEIGDGRRTLTECIVADLERLGLTNDVAVLIVTGDFITRGDWNDRVRSAAL